MTELGLLRSRLELRFGLEVKGLATVAVCVPAARQSAAAVATAGGSWLGKVPWRAAWRRRAGPPLDARFYQGQRSLAAASADRWRRGDCAGTPASAPLNFGTGQHPFFLTAHAPTLCAVLPQEAQERTARKRSRRRPRAPARMPRGRGAAAERRRRWALEEQLAGATL